MIHPDFSFVSLKRYAVLAHVFSHTYSTHPKGVCTVCMAKEIHRGIGVGCIGPLFELLYGNPKIL